MQITQQQRVDAIQRENLQVQREVDIVQEAVREKEALRAEAARRENLAAQEKEAMRNESRCREKLFLESNDRDKERAMKEIQRREELARKTALDEADKCIALIKELADEKRRSEIEREKRHAMQQEIERMQKEKEHAKAKRAALKLRVAEISAASVTETKTKEVRAETVTKKMDGLTPPLFQPAPVSYTHLTLPTNREV